MKGEAAVHGRASRSRLGPDEASGPVPWSRRELFWTLQIGGWAAYGISTYLSVLPDLGSGELLRMAALKAVRTILGFGLSLVAWRIYRRMRDRGLDLRITGAAVLGLSTALGCLWLALYWQTTSPLRGPEFFATDWAAFPRSALDHAFVFLVWSALYFGFHLWRRAERDARRRAVARAEAGELELRMLRYQLDPHFLFNALNSLRSAIPDRATSARSLVDRIASFLRHVLGTSGRSLVPLSREVEAAEMYLAIERARHGEDLSVSVSVEDGLEDELVPGFLLHPLVENAVTHGIASGASPLRVALRVSDRDGEVRIDVENDVDSWERLEGAANDAAFRGGDETGVGLSNVRRRLRLAYGDEADFRFVREPGRARASVRIQRGSGGRSGP